MATERLGIVTTGIPSTKETELVYKALDWTSITLITTDIGVFIADNRNRANRCPLPQGNPVTLVMAPESELFAFVAVAPVSPTSVSAIVQPMPLSFRILAMVQRWFEMQVQGLR